MLHPRFKLITSPSAIELDRQPQQHQSDIDQDQQPSSQRRVVCAHMNRPMAINLRPVGGLLGSIVLSKRREISPGERARRNAVVVESQEEWDYGNSRHSHSNCSHSHQSHGSHNHHSHGSHNHHNHNHQNHNSNHHNNRIHRHNHNIPSISPSPIQINSQSPFPQQNSQSSIQLLRLMPHSKSRKPRPLISNKVKLQKRDQTTIQCAICLCDLKEKQAKKIGRLDCKHVFCYSCILQSSKFSNRCPYCRASFRRIYKGNRVVSVPQASLNEQFDDPMDQPCYICGRNNDFERLLECEYCQYAYCHTYCDPRLNSDQPPAGHWYCMSCQQLLNGQPPEESEQIEEENGGEQSQQIFESD